MKIVERQITDLIPAIYNPRTLSTKQFADLKESMSTFGQMEPAIINTHEGRENIIVSGHQRLKVAESLGMDTYPCVEVDLGEDQEKELNIRMNRNTGSWDMDALANEFDLSQLLDWGFEKIDFGIIDGEDEETPLVDPGPGGPPKEPKTELGRIYQLGTHRLMCGDACSQSDVGRLMGNEKADMVFADPPYGVEFQSGSRVKTGKFDVIENDDTMLDGWIPHLERFSTGFVFIWTSWKVVDKWLELTGDIGDLSNMIIWAKRAGGLGDLEKTFATDYEISLVYNRGSKLTGKRIGSVWDIMRDDVNSYDHPTQKPVELPIQAIESTTSKYDIILDLFGGSGSTLIACEQSGRQCHMMEIDPKYCDVIIERYCKMMEIDANKVFETGEEL